MGLLGDLLIRVGLDVSEFSSGMERLNADLNTAGKEIETSLSGFDRLGESLTTVGTSLTAAVSLPLAAVGVTSLKAAADMEQTSIAFTGLLKSGEAASTMLGNLKQFAADTPFEFPELTAASTKMLALGFAAEEVIPDLTIIGDTASGLGKGAQGVDAITLALGQMRNAGKVSAQDMNQLIGAGVKAWQYLAEAAGTSVADIKAKSEKGMLDSGEAVKVILAGMQRDFGGMMAAQSLTLTGMWSNFQDQLGATAVSIGQALIPIAKQALDALKPVLTAIQGLAEWFGKLPAGAQGTILAIAGVAAAIGPLMVVVGTLLSSFASISAALPVIGTAFSALAGPVGIALAALAAIGLWVASNWEPIKATLTQAWDGVSDAWGAAWNGVILPLLQGTWEAFSSIAGVLWGAVAAIIGAVFDPVSSIFSGVWGNIGSVLLTIWNAIASAAQTVWGGITSVIGEFIAAFEKIPGVAKLLNLDDAWNSVKKGTEAVKTHTAEQQKLTTSLSDVGKKLVTNADDHGKAEKAAAKHTAEIVKQRTEVLHNSDEWKILEVGLKKVGDRHNELIKSVASLREKVNDGSISVADLAASAVILDAKFGHVITTQEELKNLQVPAWEAMKHGIDDAVKTMETLDAAYKTLGVTSSDELKTQAENARTAYETIKASGTASARDISAAHKAAVDAQIAYYKQAGIDIPKDVQKTADDLDKIISTSTDKQKTTWINLSNAITQSVADISTGMVKSLFEGDGNFGSKVVDGLKGLGEAVATQFITPATTAISNFISGAIKDLLGGSGLGGIMDSLKNIGSSISGIFGGGGASGGVGGAVGGATGGAGGAVGSIGSFLGSWGGIIGGGISAIGSIVGAAMMGGDLGHIEENTRYTFNQLFSIQSDVNKYWPGISTTVSLLSQIIDLYLGDIWNIRDRAIEISEHIRTKQYERLGGVIDAVNGIDLRGPQNVTLNIYPQATDVTAIAAEVMGEIAALYATAPA